MNPARIVTYFLDADRVGWLVFAAPAPRANVLDRATWDALAVSLEEVRKCRPVALIVRSDQQRIFIAGADLKEIAALPDAAVATNLSRLGQGLLNQLADYPGPVIAAIHGACAGGGYEVALACHWRIASDSPATKIGLPETERGTIPGWGGTVRLPRLIGPRAALEHILQAGLLPAADALRVGLVDEIVPVADLLARAKATALRLANGGRPARLLPPLLDAAGYTELRGKTQARYRGPQPVREAVMALVEKTAGLPVGTALQEESGEFGRLTASPFFRNMVHAFFLRGTAKKRTLDGWFPAGPEPVAAIRRVGVVGAGVMGSGVAHWLAVQGCDVVLRDVRPDCLESGVRIIDGLFAGLVRQGAMAAADAAAAQARIATTTGWEGFAGCDLVIEAIVEEVAAKQQLFTELAGVVQHDTLLASNTSALPIEEIAGHVPNPGRTLGLHFFNPVDRMPLVELIVSSGTSAATAARALSFVQGLGKSPVICRSAPGFVVTRVLFAYLGEAVRLWEQGASTVAIDEAMAAWGWPMGPLRLLDEIGVEVSEFIFAELARYYPAKFRAPTACHRLVAAGLRGRKTGAGFYVYGGRRPAVNPATAPMVYPRGSTPAPADIQRQLMQAMVDAAGEIVRERVVRTPDELDLALLLGTGFPEWRGGLLHWARTARFDYPERSNSKTSPPAGVQSVCAGPAPE